MPTLSTNPTRRKWIEVFGVDLGAADVDRNIYIARRNCRVTDVRFVLTAQGGASAAVVLRRCTGTTAPASGTAFTSSMDLVGTAVNTVTAATLTPVSGVFLVAGDRIAADYTGTLTALNGRLQITLETV